MGQAEHHSPSPPIGLQTRLSPSFLSRIKGVSLPVLAGPLDVTEGALLATLPKTAQMVKALSAVLMKHPLSARFIRWRSNNPATPLSKFSSGN